MKMHDYTKYFKEQKGFDRFIDKLYEKYKSLSKFSGNIRIENITEEEAFVLSRIFGVEYKRGDTLSISIKRFIAIMQKSKYDDFDINVLVEEYLNVKLVTNKEVKDKDTKEEEEYYQEIINKSNGIGVCWLKEIVSTKVGSYKLLHKRYKSNKNALKKELMNIILLINQLPKERMLLPIYSSLYTQDPHYLDIDNNHSILFFYALSYIDNSSFPSSREAKIKMLAKYNIEIDYLSNYVITYNILSDENYINCFAQNKESLILNIQNILNIENFYGKDKKVFIFENPSILTEIISQKLDVSVIVSGGFLNTSVHLLLEKLVRSNNQLYYNGDFDPEGLLIAEKLKEKYPNNLTLFCYGKCDYQNCVSNTVISDKRLKMLSKVNTMELMEIKEVLLSIKNSAYQENNKERIMKYIESIMEGED